MLRGSWRIEAGRIRYQKMLIGQIGENGIAEPGMSTEIADDSPFSPEIFFARAASRLDRVPQRAESESLGDHHLNPDISAKGMSFRDAAVLIPVVARLPEASVLLTQRTPHLSAHAGQIAFPGGKIDPEDQTPAAAALREAREEIGLQPEMVEPVGYLTPYLTRTGYRIVPVLGRVEPDHRITINPEEVTDTFEVPLAFLMTTGNHRRGSRPFKGKTRYFYEMPFNERYIWGITAGIIRGLYERVYA
jgi:8-oxo-dGTP pyrophosphatase MutT (NUDIX family)